MNHLKWLGHSSTIFDMQKKLHCENDFCDVKIVSSNGKILYAHKAILFSSSDLFKTIFKNITEASEICTILIPDVKDTILQNIVDFIYTGSISLSSSNLSEFLENINILGIKSAISFECHITNQQEKAIKFNEQTKYQSPIVLKQDDDNDNNDNDENLEKDIIEEEDVDTVDSAVSNEKNIQFLEVFNTSDVGKLSQYAIESSIEESASGDYILTENPDNTFTLSEQKLEPVERTNKRNYTSPNTTNLNSIETLSQISSGKIKPTAKKLKIGKRKIVTITQDSTENDPIDISNECNISQDRDQAFENAVQAVIDEGISLQKAAEKFQISKTVLWRRVKKNPFYNKTYRENPTIEAAIQKLEKGESLKTISQSLGIPMSTLHRHKMRLAEEGRLPGHIQVKRRDLESKENLKLKLCKAVAACLNGMSQNHAAAVFEVPKSTLWRHLQKKTAIDEKLIIVKNEQNDNSVLKTETKMEIADSEFSN